MEKELNYYPTNALPFTINEWLRMLKEDDCFTPALLEAIYILVFEMDGKGSAKQISEITGRPYQVYNSSMMQTVKPTCNSCLPLIVGRTPNDLMRFIFLLYDEMNDRLNIKYA